MKYSFCNAVAIRSPDEGLSYQCNITENSNQGSVQGIDEFWVALDDHYECPSDFTNFGIVGGCYKLYDIQMAWQDMENTCNSNGPHIHLAGVYMIIVFTRSTIN